MSTVATNLSAQRSAVSSKLALVCAFDYGPTTAGGFRQSKSVTDDETAAHHLDDPLFSEPEKAVCHTRSAYAEKLSQYLMGERDIVTLQGITREQQPAPKTLLQLMGRIARARLSCLKIDRSDIGVRYGPKRWQVSERLLKPIQPETKGGTRDLHRSAVQWLGICHQYQRCSDKSF